MTSTALFLLKTPEIILLQLFFVLLLFRITHSNWNNFIKRIYFKYLIFLNMLKELHILKTYFLSFFSHIINEMFFRLFNISRINISQI